MSYIKDTMGEMKHVRWPSKKQTFVYTILVVIVSLFTAAYLGVLDHLFSSFIKFLTK